MYQIASSIYTEKFMSYRILEIATFNIQLLGKMDIFVPLHKISMHFQIV